MSNENVLEESDRYRVRLEIDQDAKQPWDDGQWPILRIEQRDYIRTEHLNPRNARPHDLDSAVENAVRHWGVSPAHFDWQFVEKWLRAYLGVTRVEAFSSDDYWYVAYDSAAWREWAGVSAEQTATEDPLAEWRAWVNGKVYGYVVEKRVTWKPVSCPADDDVTMDTWEHVESCWGFYGYEWAREAALEEYRAYAAEKEEAK